MQNSTSSSLEATNTLATETVTTTTSQISENISKPKIGLESILPPQYTETFGFLNSTEVFGNSLLQYSFAFLTIVGVFLLLPIIWKIFVRYLSLAVEKTLPDFSTTLKQQLNKFNLKIFLIIAIYAGLSTITLPSVIILTLKGIVLALAGIQIAIICGPLIEPLIKMVPAFNKPEMKPITNRIIVIAKTAMWAIVGIFSLSAIGLDTGPILGSLGVLGLGGALAMQQMIPGFIKILGFHFSKNFGIGDKISAGSHQGVVEEIDITTSKLKKANGDIVDVKNEELLTAVVIPSDGPHFISETIKINLDIRNDLATFSTIESIFQSSLSGMPDTNFEKVLFTDLKGSGVNVDMNYSVLIDKKIENRHHIISKLITELKNKNISFTGV